MSLQEDLKIKDKEEFEKRLVEAHRLACLGLWDYLIDSEDGSFTDEVYQILGLERNKDHINVPNFFALVHPDDLAAAMQRFEKCIETGVEFADEHRIITKAGETKHLYKHITPYRDATGKIIGIKGIMQDVTRRKMAEIAHEESLQQIDKIIHSIPHSLYLLDINERRLIFDNKRSMEPLGYTNDEVKGIEDMIAKHIVAPEDVPVYMNKFVQFKDLKDGEELVTEMRLRHKKGHLIWYLSREKVFKRNPDGSPSQIIGVAEDITEQKLAQTQIRENSQLLNGMLSNLPVVVYKIDKDGLITLSKGAGLKPMGVADDETVGKNIFDLYPNTARRVKDVMNGNTVQFVSHGKNNDVDWYYDNYVFPDPEEQGGLIGFAMDITTTKKYEAELIEGKKKVEEVANIKQQFVSSMSHEIRTPMNGVIGMTNLLLDTKLNPEQQEYVNLIRESADNLLVIINDILDFSKLSAGMMVLKHVEFSMNDLVSNVVKLLKHKAKEKKLKFSVRTDTELPSVVLGDPVRLRQILLNLLGNALKFTDKGEISLSVEVKEWQNHKAVIEFRVTDTGIGIPEEKIDTIFDNFIQVVDNTDRHTTGTGLGLSIARQLVEALGGNIWVKSMLDNGSVFGFTLPLDYIGDLQKEPLQSENATQENLNNLRILLVEDNLINQRVAKLTLEKMGASVTVAENGRRALDELNLNPFDLIITDIQMPIMNGFEATNHIRALKSDLSKIPIIAMTASALAGEREKCIQAGMNSFVSKPFTTEDILNAIAECLAAKKNKASIKTNSRH